MKIDCVICGIDVERSSWTMPPSKQWQTCCETCARMVYFMADGYKHTEEAYRNWKMPGGISFNLYNSNIKSAFERVDKLRCPQCRLVH
jgi:hypothetical protein